MFKCSCSNITGSFISSWQINYTQDMTKASWQQSSINVQTFTNKMIIHSLAFKMFGCSFKNQWAPNIKWYEAHFNPWIGFKRSSFWATVTNVIQETKARRTADTLTALTSLCLQCEADTLKTCIHLLSISKLIFSRCPRDYKDHRLLINHVSEKWHHHSQEIPQASEHMEYGGQTSLESSE